MRDQDIYFGKQDTLVRGVVFALNLLNVLLAFFTLVLFLVVRCPVKYQKVIEEHVEKLVSGVRMGELVYALALPHPTITVMTWKSGVT